MYMEHNQFDKNSAVQELSFDEIDDVNGAFLGVALIAGVAVGAAAVGLFALGYTAAHNRANRG